MFQILVLILTLTYQASVWAQEPAECGLVGELQTRIHDCHKVYPFESVEVRDREHIWQLASVSAEGKQVWLHQNTQMLWTSRPDFEGLFEDLFTYEEAHQFCKEADLGANVKLGMDYGFRLPLADEVRTALKAGLAKVFFSGVCNGEFHHVVRCDSKDHSFVDSLINLSSYHGLSHWTGSLLEVKERRSEDLRRFAYVFSKGKVYRSSNIDPKEIRGLSGQVYRVQAEHKVRCVASVPLEEIPQVTLVNESN